LLCVASHAPDITLCRASLKNKLAQNAFMRARRHNEGSVGASREPMSEPATRCFSSLEQLRSAWSRAHRLSLPSPFRSLPQLAVFAATTISATAKADRHKDS